MDANSRDQAVSRAMIALMKGAVDREEDARNWGTVIDERYFIDEYMQKLGLVLTVDDIDGYAYLRQKQQEAGEDELPRLISRHQLGYKTTILLVLLRKRLLEADAESGSNKVVVTTDQIIALMKTFLPETSNEARQIKQIQSTIDNVRKMGFLKRLGGRGHDTYEVRRILRSFVDAQWMGEVDDKLEALVEYGEKDGRDAPDYHFDEDVMPDDEDQGM